MICIYDCAACLFELHTISVPEKALCWNFTSVTTVLFRRMCSTWSLHWVHEAWRAFLSVSWENKKLTFFQCCWKQHFRELVLLQMNPSSWLVNHCLSSEENLVKSSYVVSSLWAAISVTRKQPLSICLTWSGGFGLHVALLCVWSFFLYFTWHFLVQTTVGIVIFVCKETI